MKMIARAAMLAAGALLVTSVAQAQEPASPVSFGVKAGAAMPMGDFGKESGTGWYLGGVLGFRPATLPVHFNFDVGYTSFGEQRLSVDGITLTAQPSIIVGTANVVAMFGEGQARPFATGGVGLYNLRSEVSCSGSFCGGVSSASDSETKAGVNVGGGVNFPLAGLQSVVEARFNHIFAGSDSESDRNSSLQYLNLSFGIMFR